MYEDQLCSCSNISLVIHAIMFCYNRLTLKPVKPKWMFAMISGHAEISHIQNYEALAMARSSSK